MKNKIKEEIRKICTYHTDSETSGYNLSEVLFHKIFNLSEEQYQKGAKDMLGLISKEQAWEKSREYYHKKFFKEMEKEYEKQ